MQLTDANAVLSESPRSQIVRLQRITIAWMLIEVLVALTQAIRARSVSLGAFGLDSVVELLSAVVVLFTVRLAPGAERKTATVAAGLLYALGVCIVFTSVVSLMEPLWRPEPTPVGIVLLLAAGVVMPFLGRAKKRLSATVKSCALRADAAQSNLCAWTAWIATAGLVLNAAFGLWWADSVAALLLLPIVITEANAARRGECCTC